MPESVGAEQWVVFELSRQGEKLSRPELDDLLLLELGEDAEVFIPSITFSRRGSNMSVCLMEGYFFVKSGLPVTTYFALEDQPFVKRILTQDEDTDRLICYVGGDVVNDLRRKLQDQAARTLQPDDYVVVVEGPFANLKGKIIDVFSDKGSATIHIVDLKSMEIIVELPFQFFEHTDDLDGV